MKKNKLFKNLENETIEKIKLLSALENKDQAHIIKKAILEYYKKHFEDLIKKVG